MSRSRQEIIDRTKESIPGVSGTMTPDAFNQMITDSSSFSLTIDSGSRNAIQWIAAKDRILIGTSGGEWRLSGHSNKPLTPMNYEIKAQTVWGSKDMQPLVLHEAVLFVDFVGKKLREMIWNGTEERYLSPDLLLLAEHITKSGGITTMAYQRHPDSIIWATLANGDLISCTYVREQDVIAWARHPLLDTTDSSIASALTYSSYPTLQVADSTFATTQTDLGLTHTTAITNVGELRDMVNDLAGNYYLANDIDASPTEDWNDGEGFVPIGEYLTYFTGTFDGCGYTISDLFINLPANDGIGLFGWINGASIANVTLDNPTMTGEDDVAPLVGAMTNPGTISSIVQNCHVTGGEVKSQGDTDDSDQGGGLIGYSQGNATYTNYIYDCTTSCTVDYKNHHTFSGVTSTTDIGGFIGALHSSTTVSNCRATGNVSAVDTNGEGFDQIGGFAGTITGGDILVEDCSATGNVEGGQATGGFAGHIDNSPVSGDTIVRRCSARGNVVSVSAGNEIDNDRWAGGFSGEIQAFTTGDNCTVQDCYSWGTVTVTVVDGDAFGCVFVADTYRTLTILDNCYGIGAVTTSGDSSPVEEAYNKNQTLQTDSTVTNCFWDTDVSGIDDSDYGTGHTSVWMKTRSNYLHAGWDFGSVWEMTPLSTTAAGLGAESICVIPGTTEDEVWIMVARAIGGSIVRYIERMKPRYWGTDQEDCFFVDSGLTYDSTPANNFTGLGHLEGETVAILGDGGVFPTQVVTGGTLPENLDQTVSVAHIGLAYTYKLKPMRADQNVGGTTKGSIKVTAEAVVSFYKTLNARYGDGTDSHGIDFRTTEAYTTPPALHTGDKLVHPDAGYSAEDPFQIEGSDPLPCTVRCIIPRIEKTGR